MSASTPERPFRPSGVLETSMSAARVSSSERDMAAAGFLGVPIVPSQGRREAAGWPCASSYTARRGIFWPSDEASSDRPSRSGVVMACRG